LPVDIVAVAHENPNMRNDDVIGVAGGQQIVPPVCVCTIPTRLTPTS